jgi:hypothetical protein
MVKLPTSKRKVQSSNFDSDCVVVEEPPASEVTTKVMENHRRFKSCPGEIKSAKEDQC